jgi:DNA-binding NarL/FixJ family response regulator
MQKVPTPLPDKKSAQSPIVADERRDKPQRPRDEIEWALRERVKELNCLYGIAQLLDRHSDDLDGFLQGVVDLLPGSWQYPECACARIQLGDRQFVSARFKASAWRQGAEITQDGKAAGAVEVFYFQRMPASNEGPFLKEERALIDAVAERVERVAMHMQARQELDAAHRALQMERHALREANTALRSVLVRIEEEKAEIKKSILANIHKVVMPVVLALETEVPRQYRPYVALLRQSLQEIASPFVNELSRAYTSLSPAEIAVATMIRNGLTTKEIADMRHISPATVRRHRDKIRRKLGLANRKVNLTTHLQSVYPEDARQPSDANQLRGDDHPE